MELPDVPLFRGLTADEAEAAVTALRMRRRAFAKGEILLEAGQRAPALGVVLGGLLSIPAMPLGSYTLKIGLGVLPVIVTAVLYGPLYGGTVGALTDLLQALIFPKGAYMPWFTVIGALFGVIPGMFFVKSQKPTLKLCFQDRRFAVWCSIRCCSCGSTGLRGRSYMRG